MRIDVVDRTDDRSQSIDTQALERGLAMLLKPPSAFSLSAPPELADFRFRNAAQGEIGWQLEMTIAFVTERTSDDDPDRLRRAVGLSTDLRSLGEVDGLPRSIAVDTLKTEDVPRDSARITFLEAGVSEAVRRLSMAADLWRAPDADVVAALSGTDETRRGLAVVVAGQRRLKSAVLPLSSIVRGDADETTILQAVGALVSIGEPSAVGALIDAARQRSAPYLKQIIFAVGEIGGEEAEAYLFTVRNGHSDPAVRESAREALDEMLRRRASVGNPPEPLE
ncbi:MAG: HEAT repeat domain-containing protein [Deltaproteobacteria bacterium]|nr:HEAT repeat domain-containing protein [Deltaproteobacteria bacterium]